MDRMQAVEKIADAARVAVDRATGGEQMALRSLAWAPRNAKSFGETYTAGFLNGVAQMATSGGVYLHQCVQSALFMASEALGAQGDVPDDAIVKTCRELRAFAPGRLPAGS